MTCKLYIKEKIIQNYAIQIHSDPWAENKITNSLAKWLLFKIINNY